MKFAVSTDAGRTYSVQVPSWLLAATLLTALLWQPATAWASDQFSDVSDSNIFHGDIAWMAETGVTAGCGDGQFCPKDNVTREQMSAFMRRLDSQDVFTTFAEVESMLATGSSGPIDADTLDGIDSAAFATDAEVASLLTAVESRLDELEALLDGVSRDGDLLMFAGMNVQLVDGSGDTAGAVNGLGNLIVGYNENPAGYDRTGSHNLVVGRNHGYTSSAGLVAGENNRIQGSAASVTGGQYGVASGTVSSVSGGRFNEATAFGASVSGGYDNDATSSYASVSGGRLNIASGSYASVSGGRLNIASGSYASVSGGYDAEASDIYDWWAGTLFETD